MAVTRERDGTVRLEGACPVEDAEALLGHLLETPGAAVDWRDCEGAHAAVVQVLLAVRPVLRGPPRDPLLRERIAPLLARPA